MSWKENKLVAWAGVGVIILSLALGLYPFLKEQFSQPQARPASASQRQQSAQQRPSTSLAQSQRERPSQKVQETRGKEPEPVVEEEVVTQKKLRRENPFLTYQQRRAVDEDSFRKPIKPERFSLSSIVYSKDRSYAVIDGKVKKPGDMINNLRIVKIKPREVIFKDIFGREYALKLGSMSYAQ